MHEVNFPHCTGDPEPFPTTALPPFLRFCAARALLLPRPSLIFKLFFGGGAGCGVSLFRLFLLLDVVIGVEVSCAKE